MIRSFYSSTWGATAAALLALGGCTTVSNLTSGDKIDYRSAGTTTRGLDIPPDLTQLMRDSRYPSQTGQTVSASDYQSALAPAADAGVAPTPLVAVAAAGDVRLERLGNERWLSTTLPPERLWPLLRQFWQERGFGLAVDDAPTGTMETQWAENRAKLPQDFIRNTIGRAIDAVYSTGERDKFRTRVERTPVGSEIYITHRGMVEVYADTQRTQTVWQPRPTDPQLEGELLSRLMVKLGAKEDTAKTAVVASAAPVSAASARARLVEGRPAATLQVDDDFDRAWRRVGLALDRSGFTVEDRDRSQGQYFVRYVDPAQAGRSGDQPGFLRRLLRFGSKGDSGNIVLARYRVAVKADDGARTTTVSVLNGQGAPENGDAARRIVRLLVDDLK